MLLYVPVGVYAFLALLLAFKTWRAIRVEGHAQIFNNFSVDGDAILSEVRWGFLAFIAVGLLFAASVATAVDHEWGSVALSSTAIFVAVCLLVAFVWAPSRRVTDYVQSGVATSPFTSASGEGTSPFASDRNIKKYNPEHREAVGATVMTLHVTPLAVTRRQSKEYLLQPPPNFSFMLNDLDEESSPELVDFQEESTAL